MSEGIQQTQNEINIEVLRRAYEMSDDLNEKLSILSEINRLSSQSK